MMPNHARSEFTAIGEHLPADIVQSWKSYTAKEVNKLPGRKGQFWSESTGTISFEMKTNFDESAMRFKGGYVLPTS